MVILMVIIILEGARGRDRFGRGQNRPQCQMCVGTGHVALNCYYKFDHNFQGQSFS